MNRFLQELARRGVEYNPTPFSVELRTAQSVADALCIRVAQVAKTVLVKSLPASYTLVLLPGDRRIDLRALARFLGATHCALASRDEVRCYTGLPVGAVSPLIRICGTELPVVIDADLLKESLINISAGDLHLGISIKPDHLSELVSAMVARISI